MKDFIIGRRDLIRLGFFAGLVGLSSCGITPSTPLLVSYKGVLPKELLKTLPSNWRFEMLDASGTGKPFRDPVTMSGDLLATGDGWLQSFSFEEFKTIGEENLKGRLNQQANTFLTSFSPSIASKIIPIGFSPWVMLFRGNDELLLKARQTWQVLLEPELKGKLVLPRSTRLIMALADQMGGDKELVRLREQVITFDEQNSMNWLLSGRAKVVVLPLQHCVNQLIRDPRLSVALPSEGAPLNWTILMRPAKAIHPLPSSWIKALWSAPILGKLVSKGWFPPLPYVELMELISDVSFQDHSGVLKSKDLYERLWSLTPLNRIEKNSLELRWLNSSP